MLRRLVIRDFVIVDRLELEFSPGFGALTGETGAGKSILIDALALALGARADPATIRTGCERAEVAATFAGGAIPAVREWLAANDIADDEELILRRVVDAAGRSRGYINGSPATVQQLRELGECLVDIHGQHAHQSLLRGDAQRQLFDAHAGHLALVADVAAAWRVWRDADAALRAAAADGEAQAREREQLEWQVRELEMLGLGAGEWPELESEHRRLAHAATLAEGAQFGLALLADGDGACDDGLERVAGRIEELAGYDQRLAEVAALLRSAQTELGEAVSQLRRYGDRVDLDPARFGEVERRIEAVLACARKYRVSPEALPAMLEQASARLAELTVAADAEALARRSQQARDAYVSLAGRLSAARGAAASQMGPQVSALMHKLALASGRFEVALLPLAEGLATGLEQVEFRVAGLAADDARPLAKVASGGELSRISLAIQVLTSRSARVPTLIFDEVDVGIGGRVAEIVGRLLAELGRERQVLSVTHLPQVAARADWQWRVSKETHDGAVLSSIEPLDDDARVGEIARMLGGVDVSGIARDHAREMLRSTPLEA
ncbi:MAG: DNA repair protein RecN [Betaproteobacteria bacterium]|nr:DNA repair protein RecN [Betaproteobacteria bacterium]